MDDNLADCLRNYPVFDHASNLGGLMARAFAQPLGIPAYIYDAVTSDEMVPEARVTGFKEVMRTSFCHVLNARATSHKYAETLGRRYEDMNLVVAHLGGGISISAHRHGRIIDSVSDDAGPFSPDRSGSLNMLYVVDLCYSGKYTKKDMLKKLRGEGGMSALLGTHDCREIERRIQEGDEWAALVYQAQALQIAKGVGIMLGCFHRTDRRGDPHRRPGQLQKADRHGHRLSPQPGEGGGHPGGERDGGPGPGRAADPGRPGAGPHLSPRLFPDVLTKG
ncbi:MAG: butyrate kinase [Flavonifractor plautii]